MDGFFDRTAEEALVDSWQGSHPHLPRLDSGYSEVVMPHGLLATGFFHVIIIPGWVVISAVVIVGLIVGVILKVASKKKSRKRVGQ